MTAINLSHFKNRLKNLSRELFLDHGWELPNGLRRDGGKSSLNFTLDEWQQARRLGLHPREIKQAFQDAWKQSDSKKAFLGGADGSLEPKPDTPFGDICPLDCPLDLKIAALGWY